MINNSGKPVVAVDIPSGLSSNNGKVMGVCVKATMTVTFSNPKIGLIVYPGMEYTGKLFVIDICIPKNLQEEEWVWGNYLVFDDLKGLIKRRNANTFKNNFGHLFILAGSEGKTGAASMACEAAMRVGTGLVTLGIPQSLNPILEMKLTEVMTEPLPETKDYSLAFSAYEKVVNLCAGKSALAIGPGISTSEETSRVISQILLQTDLPTVIDADALTLLSQNVSQLKSMKAPKIITPHPGEMGRLIKKSPSEVQANRVEIARDFSQEFCVYTILKGARTVIADPRGHVYINSTGNPAMASGGMGDILTGMVSGFLAQGYSPLDSARLGVFLHGFCGDKWAEHNGDAGLIATDLLHMIPLMMKKLCDG